MLETLGIVEVGDRERRCRQFSHLAASRFAGKSLVEWIVRRVTDSLRLDGVIAVMSTRLGAEIAHYVPPDVPVFQCCDDDPLERMVAAVDEYPAKAIVRVGLHTPFVDPTLIDRLITDAEEHPGCDYVSYRSNDGRPVVQSQLGLFAEWCKTAALRRADRECRRLDHRQLITHYVYSNPELFQLRFIRVPSALDRDDVRLTLAAQDDWENAEAIFDALGPDGLDWHRIAGLLDQQPALREKMAQLNRVEATADSTF